jgi:hypothetical protein
VKYAKKFHKRVTLYKLSAFTFVVVLIIYTKNNSLMKTNIQIALSKKGGDPIKPKIEPPVKPEKNIPLKPDKNPDPTKPIPGINEPERVDPTRIDNPTKDKQLNVSYPA